MRTFRDSVILVAGIVMLVTTGAVGAEEQLSNTRVVSCIVKITVDPAILTLNPGTVEGLIRSSGVAAKAAREALGLDPERVAHVVYKFVEIEWLVQGSQGSSSLQPETPLAGGSVHGPMYGGGNRDSAALVERTPSQNKVGIQERVGENLQNKPSQTAPSVTRMTGSAGLPMGRYAGMGMGGFGVMGGGMAGMYGMPLAPSWVMGIQQSATFRLSVQLPDDVRPAAEEFLQAIVSNLRDTLEYAFERREGELVDLVSRAERRHESALEDLAELLGTKPSRSAEGTEVDTALSTMVDLSSLTPEMPFGEAIELLKNSVSPPLQMTVVWRDLFENGEVEPATPIEMDPLSRVEVKTALELMLKTVSRGLAELGYRIQGNVIVIGTAETIEPPQEVSTPPRTEEADIQELAAWRRELRRNLQAIEMDLASIDARQEAIERQMQIARHELADKQAGDEITQELAMILKTNEELLRNLEVQVQAGQMPMSGLAKAKADVAQVRIDLARRREELAKSAGGGQLSRFSSELSDMAIEKAEGLAKLDMLRRQLDETQVQLDRAAAFDPRAARIRAARETVDGAELRLATLNRRLASLEPAAVIVIGAK